MNRMPGLTFLISSRIGKSHSWSSGWTAKFSIPGSSHHVYSFMEKSDPPMQIRAREDPMPFSGLKSSSRRAVRSSWGMSFRL